MKDKIPPFFPDTKWTFSFNSLKSMQSYQVYSQGDAATYSMIEHVELSFV